jgi:TPP-dependent pyruvate/acetoin dehydrogenase alpha subunit
MKEPVSPDEQINFYKSMLKIRAFEQKCIQLYAEGYIPGHIHLYIGEEPIASGVCMHMRESDFVFSSHRAHGHLIAKGARLDKLFAENFGREWGYNHGKGGHMHIMAPDVRVLADGIVGGGFGPAVGTAVAQKLQKKGDVTAYFFGDGAANQGCLYEVMNMAALWDLPLLLVLEDNRYAISTSTSASTAKPGIAARAKAFGIVSEKIDGYDPMAMYAAGKRAVARARKGDGTTLLEVTTYRLRGHREGDPQTYRTREEVAEWRKKDPVKAYAKYLQDENIMTPDEQKLLKKEIDAEIEQAVCYALESPYPDPERAVKEVVG